MQINNSMQENTNKQQPGQETPMAQRPAQPQGKLNEFGRLYIDGFVKIHDPNTKEVYLETRA